MMFKVVHRLGDTETAYLVEADCSRDAKAEVIAEFGIQTTCGSIAAVQHRGPAKLYSINTKTGEIS